jgi:glutathione S-transferase
VDNQLSYVDVVLYAHFDACRSIEPDCLKPFPALSAHFARVGAREKLKAYLEKRPESGL